MYHSLKTVALTVKRIESWDSWVPLEHIWGTVDLIVFNVIWLIHVCLKMTCKLKMAGCRVKRSEICDLMTLVTHMGYL